MDLIEVAAGRMQPRDYRVCIIVFAADKEQLAAAVAEEIRSKAGIGWDLVQFVLAQGKLVLLDAA